MSAIETAGANLLLLSEAEALARLFEQARITAVFLKGIALVDDVYPDIADRPMDDIDVLVEPDDLERALELLRRAGYGAPGNAMLARKQTGAIPIQVDLHHELPCFEGREFLERARLKPTAGSRISVLAREDQLLHCIFHSVVQDGEISARALEDARRIVQAPGQPFRWELFFEIVRREGWERPVETFLAGMALPARLQSLSPYRRMLALQSKPLRRAALLRRLLFPDAGFLRLRYSWVPLRLAFLLPILRPIFLGAAILAGIARRLPLFF